jgi:hypothetical protein
VGGLVSGNEGLKFGCHRRSPVSVSHAGTVVD